MLLDCSASVLRQAIRSGQLQSGSKLPSTRMLSENLGLSRNTVLRAYEQLRIERLGVMREGSGTYVSDVPLRLIVLSQRPSGGEAVGEPPVVTLVVAPEGG